MKSRRSREQSTTAKPPSPDQLFSAEELIEIKNLAEQSLPGAREKALERLQVLENMYQQQVMNNTQVEQVRSRRNNITTGVIVVSSAVGMTGILIENNALLFTSFAIGYGALVANRRQLIPDIMGVDPVPFRGAERRLEYIQITMMNHPDAPVQGVEQ